MGDRILYEVASDSMTVKNRLHKKLFDLLAIHPDETFHGTVIINKGLSEFIAISTDDT